MGLIVEAGKWVLDERRWYRGFVLLGWMYRQIRVPRRTRQICHIRGEQSEPAARISRYAAPSKGQARVVGSDIDSLNRRTMSLVLLIKTRQDGSWTVAASSASRRRMYARWPRPLPLPPSLFLTLDGNTRKKLRNYAAVLYKKVESRKRSFSLLQIDSRDKGFLIIGLCPRGM